MIAARAVCDRASNQASSHAGFSLIELLLALVIVGVIAGIALPLYQGYVDSARETVLLRNISTLEVFQEDFRMRQGAYLTSADTAAEITAAIGWAPAEGDAASYTISPVAPGSYRVQAESTDGASLCLILPARQRC